MTLVFPNPYKRRAAIVELAKYIYNRQIRKNLRKKRQRTRTVDKEELYNNRGLQEGWSIK